MANRTFVDISYELIGYIERKNRWLTPIIIGCIVLAPAGILMNAIVFILLSRQKDGFFDLNSLIIMANIAICSLFLVIGMSQYALLKRSKNQIRELESLEEKINQEVLGLEV